MPDDKNLLRRLVAQVKREGRYHSLLMRQLRKAGIADPEAPPDLPAFSHLLQAVDACYREHDRDRATMERAMALASDEMRELQDNLRRQNETLERVLGGYVPRDLSRHILANPGERLAPGGDVKLVTVLVARARGLDACVPPRDARRLLQAQNALLARLVPCALEEEGMVDDIHGEHVVVFGSLAAAPDDASRAARTALAMQASVAILRAREPEMAPVTLAAGLATGYAAIGNLGTAERMTYTCVGEIRDIAHALEAAAGAGETLVCPDTVEALGATAEIATGPAVSVRSRRAHVPASRLLGIG